MHAAPPHPTTIRCTFLWSVMLFLHRRCGASASDTWELEWFWNPEIEINTNPNLWISWEFRRISQRNWKSRIRLRGCGSRAVTYETPLNSKLEIGWFDSTFSVNLNPKCMQMCHTHKAPQTQLSIRQCSLQFLRIAGYSEPTRLEIGWFPLSRNICKCVTRARHHKGIFWYGSALCNFETGRPNHFYSRFFAQTFLSDFVTMH